MDKLVILKQEGGGIMFVRKTTEIPVSMIRTNKQQPRQIFGEEQLIELRDSIKEFGILQPLILKKQSDGE